MEYKLAFDDEFEDELRNNRKTSTIRYGLESVPEEGKRMEAYSGAYTFTVHIQSVEKTHIKQLPLYDFEGHTNYTSVEEAVEHLQQYYHDTLTPTSTVHIIYFTIVSDKT